MGVADNNMAKLYRKEWNFYVDNVIPYEDKLIDFATNDTVVGDQVKATADNFASGLQTSLGTQARNDSRLGLSRTARETESQRKTIGLNNAAAKVAGMNQTRSHVQDLQTQIMLGSNSAGLKEAATLAAAG